jgi:hypothetical protein
LLWELSARTEKQAQAATIEKELGFYNINLNMACLETTRTACAPMFAALFVDHEC